MSFLVHERGQYEPPACEGCGQRHHVQWVETTTIDELSRGQQSFLPGQTYCRTSGCVYNDLEQAR